MPDNYYSEVNENGVVTPFRDLAAFPRSEQAVLGAVNIMKNTGLSGGSSGITQSIDSDGVTTVSGKATATKFIKLAGSTESLKLVEGKRYKLVGCPSGGSANTYKMDFRTDIGGVTSVICEDFGNGAVFTMPTVPAGGSNQYSVFIKVENGYEFTSPAIFKPMITIDLDATYADFAPYAMTNKELTEKVQGIINAATNAADFAAFKTAIGNL